MSESDHDSDQGTWLVNTACLEALRLGSKVESENAYKTLRLRSRQILRRRFRGSLKEEDFDDIFSSAIADTLPWLLDDGVGAEEVSHELEKALERHKKSFKRDHLRLVQRDTFSLRDHEDYFETREQIIDLQRIVAEIEETFSAALGSLGDRDRHILIEELRLGGNDEEGNTPRLTFPSDDARRQAVSRAKRRFNEALEELLEQALHGATVNREVLETALSIVRGGALPTALALVSG